MTDAMHGVAAPATTPRRRKRHAMAIWQRHPVWWLWFEFGLAFGVTVLLRQVFLLFGPFLYAWLWWAVLRPSWHPQDQQWYQTRLSRAESLLRGSLLSILIALMLVLPWTVRNQWAFGTFVPLNTNSGYAFFWGNHPVYGTKFVGILPDDGPSYYDLIPPELLHLNEAELDRALLKQGFQFVFDDPMRYLLLSASRTREYFKFWPSPESGTVSNIARVGSFGLLLPFMLYGLWLAAKLAWRWRKPPGSPLGAASRSACVSRSENTQQLAAILLLGSFCLIYTGIHLLTWALIRYRLPVDAVLVIFAALGIVELAARVRQRHQFHDPKHGAANWSTDVSLDSYQT